MDGRSRSALVALLVFSALLCVVISPVAGQAGPATPNGTTTTNGTNGTATVAPIGGNTTNETGNPTENATQNTTADETTNDSDRTVVDGAPGTAGTGEGSVTNTTVGGGSGSAAGGIVGGMVADFLGGFGDGVRNSLDSFQQYLLGLPAPGTYDNVSSWVNPNEMSGWWPSIVRYHLSLVGLCLVGMVARGLQLAGYDDLREQRQEYRRLAYGFLFLITSTVILGMALHLGNALALGIAPDGAEFLESPGNAARFGVGALIGAILLAAWNGIVFAGLGIIAVQWVAVHFLYALLPVFVLAYMFRFTPVRWFGASGIYAFGGLILLKILQALILRFIFELPLDPTGSAGSSAFLSIFAMIAGLVIGLVWVPKQFLKAMPATVSGVVETANSTARQMPDIVNNARENVGNARERYDSSVRGRLRSSSDTGPQEPPSTAKPHVPSSGHPRPSSGGSDNGPRNVWENSDATTRTQSPARAGATPPPSGTASQRSLRKRDEIDRSSNRDPFDRR